MPCLFRLVVLAISFGFLLTPLHAAKVIEKQAVITTRVPITALACHNSRIVTGHSDGSVRWWNPDGTEPDDIWLKLPHGVTHLSLLDIGGLLAVACEDSTVHIYDVQKQKELAEIKIKGKIQSLEFDFKYLMVLADDLCFYKQPDYSLFRTEKVKGPSLGMGVCNLAKQSFYYSAVNRTLFSMEDGKKTGLFKGKKLEGPKQRVLEIKVSARFRYGFAALSGGEIIPFTDFDQPPRFRTQIPDMKTFSIFPGREGKYVVCLGRGEDAGKGFIWEMLQEYELAAFKDLPETIVDAASDEMFPVLAVQQDEFHVLVWAFDEAISLKRGYEPLLGGKVRNPYLEKAPQRPLPVANPDAIFAGGSWTATKWAAPDAPAFMANALKLTGRDPRSFPPISSASKAGLFLLVTPEAGLGESNPETMTPYDYAVLTDAMKWCDCGLCPWRDKSRMFALSVNPSQKPPHWRLAPLKSRDELFFIPAPHLAPVDINNRTTTFVCSTDSLAEAYRLLSQSKFADLDRIVEKARAEKSMDGPVTPTVVSMLDATDSPQVGGKPMRQVIEQYLAARPDSYYAKLAKVEFLINDAWKARGSDYADMTSEEQFEGFREKLQEAGDLLATIGLEDDPIVASKAIPVLQSKDAGPDVAISTALKGLHDDYLDMSLVDQASHFLLPRWSLDRQGPEKLIRKLRDQFPAPLGDAMAARVAAYVLGWDGEQFMSECGMDAEEFVRCADAYAKIDPDDITIRPTAINFRMRMADTPEAQKAIWNELGFRVDADVFGDVATLNELQVALSGGHPLRSQWSRILPYPGVIRILPNGTEAVLFEDQGRIRKFDLTRGDPAGDFSVPLQKIHDVTISPEGIAIALTDRSIVTLSGKHPETSNAPKLSQYDKTAIGLQGRRLGAIQKEELFVVLDPSHDKPIAKITLSKEFEDDLWGTFEISPDGKTAVVTSEPNKVLIVDLETGKMKSKFEIKSPRYKSLGFSADSRKIIVVDGRESAEYDIETKTRTFASRSILREQASITTSADGKLWAATSPLGILVLDQRERSPGWKRLLEYHGIRSASWHPTENRLLICGSSGILNYLDLQNPITEATLYSSSPNGEGGPNPD